MLQPSGGAIKSRLISAATTNATSVKAAAGNLISAHVSNAHASNAAFLKFYNKASAPTVGTDTPVFTLRVRAAAEREVLFPIGANFDTGIALAITGAVADTDTTAIGANDVVVNLTYL